MKTAALVLASCLTLPGCLMFEVRAPGGVVVREIQILRHTETRVVTKDVEVYQCSHAASPGLLQAGVQGAAVGGIATGGNPIGAAAGGGVGLISELLDNLSPIEQRDYCLQPWAVADGKIPDARKRLSGAGTGVSSGGDAPAPVAAGERPRRIAQEPRSRGAPTEDPLEVALWELRADAGYPQVRPQAPVAWEASAPGAGLRVAAIRVVDGDTVEAEMIFPVPELDIGVRAVRQIRLLGYDAPELHGRCPAEKALAADAAGRLAEIVHAAKDLRVTGWDAGGDRYGRPLGRLYADGAEVMPMLAADGLARVYDGRGPRQPWCS